MDFRYHQNDITDMENTTQQKPSQLVTIFEFFGEGVDPPSISMEFPGSLNRW